MSTTVGSVFSSASKANAAKTGTTGLTSADFLKLFVTQLQNQDFNDPMDNGEMMNQITQLSNMQMMQEMANYSKTGYALSLVGKTVTASRFTDGALETVTGTVSKVSLVDNEYVLYVGGKKFTLEQIMELSAGSGSPALDLSGSTISVSSVTDNSVSIKWDIPTEDEAMAAGLKYSVYYSTQGPMDTVEAVEENGILFGAAGQKALQGAIITGLEAGQSYYINVLVMDAQGSKYVFKPALITTNQ